MTEAGVDCYSSHDNRWNAASPTARSKARIKLHSLSRRVTGLFKGSSPLESSWRRRSSGKCRVEEAQDSHQPSLGFLEGQLCKHVVDGIFSYLDTPSMIQLSMTSYGIKQQARSYIREIDYRNMKYGVDLLWNTPSCFGRMRKVLMPWDKLCSSAVPSLIQQLPYYPNLEVLSFEYRNFRCNDAKALAEVINDEAACRQLKSLDVSCNFLRKEGGRALASCLFQLPHLQVLKLSDNSIYFEAALSVCDAVKLGAIPSLTHLGLAYNWIGVLGSRAVGSALGSGRLSNLRQLDLRGNGITSVGLCFLVEAMMEACLGPDYLPSSTYDEEEEAEEQNRPSYPIPEGFQSPCVHIEEILLSYNYIGPEGALALAEVIQLGLCPKLHILSLTHNSIDDVAGARLEQACGSDCFVEY